MDSSPPAIAAAGAGVKRCCARVLRIAVALALILWTGWSTLAIYYSDLPGPARTGAAALFPFATAVLWRFVRPRRRALLSAFLLQGGVLAWWFTIPPSNDRQWSADVSTLARADIDGDRVTIHNVRNCEFLGPTECTVRYYDRTFDLSKLCSVDFILSYWGPQWMAHTMLSFGFESGDQVCISIETRKEVGESYSAIRGFFKQYELIYVVGDERDLIRQRTNVRREQVYLYRLKTAPEVRRAVFLDYLRMVNELTVRPEWYNALANNCTTTIRGHTLPYAPESRWNWKLLLNGFADRLAYQSGAIQGDLPFEEIRARSLINDRAAAAADDPEFSRRIREGLPGSNR